MKQPRKTNGQYSTKNYKLFNWRIWVLVAGFVYCAMASHYGNMDNTYVAEPDVFMKPIVVIPEPTLEDKIKEYFPKNWKTMIAIAHAESGMDMDATGYNCYYLHGKVILKKVKGAVSQACKVEDRSKAWSVDCFALQMNYPGRKTCPEGVTVDMHLRETANLSRVQGLNAWVTYQTGSHKKYLANK